MKSKHLRFEEKTIIEADLLAKSIGVCFNDLINILLKKAIRDGGIDLSNAISIQDVPKKVIEDAQLNLKIEKQNREKQKRANNSFIAKDKIFKEKLEKIFPGRKTIRPDELFCAINSGEL